jgi:hypothetical protein
MPYICEVMRKHLGRIHTFILLLLHACIPCSGFRVTFLSSVNYIWMTTADKPKIGPKTKYENILIALFLPIHIFLMFTWHTLFYKEIPQPQLLHIFGNKDVVSSTLHFRKECIYKTCPEKEGMEYHLSFNPLSFHFN